MIYPLTIPVFSLSALSTSTTDIFWLWLFRLFWLHYWDLWFFYWRFWLRGSRFFRLFWLRFYRRFR
jgi:hypothetical protein